jgi:hypothetical protein
VSAPLFFILFDPFISLFLLDRGSAQKSFVEYRQKERKVGKESPFRTVAADEYTETTPPHLTHDVWHFVFQ